MFIHYNTEGIILKKDDLREADQLFTVYTQDFGKLEVLGKAIRKIQSKLRSGADIFYLSKIEFIQGKNFKTLTDAILLDKFKNIRKDLKRLKVAYKISEILDNLIKDQEADEEIWELLLETFKRLDSEHAKDETTNPEDLIDKIYYYFFWNFLSILGYQLDLYRCLVCQKKLTPDALYFNQKEAGIVCSVCFKKMKNAQKIEESTIKILRILYKKDWSILKRLRLGETDLNLLEEVSDNYLSAILNQN
jgi:DNA repair protein RecO (recombination protein O)